jgi:hypothetical protein
MIIQVTLGGKASFATLNSALIRFFTGVKSEVGFEVSFFKKSFTAIFYGTEILSFTFVLVQMDLKPL